jgi:hypothetical protein
MSRSLRCPEQGITSTPSSLLQNAQHLILLDLSDSQAMPAGASLRDPVNTLRSTTPKLMGTTTTQNSRTANAELSIITTETLSC